MPLTSPNILCLKTGHTFKNKQALARTKRVLKHFKQRGIKRKHINLLTLPNSEIAKELKMDFNKCDGLFSKYYTNSGKRVSTCQTVVNYILIAILITLITPGSAIETEETSISINKPIMMAGWVRFSSEYVRCFCNLPACVSTGYMCKSSGGGCFSDLLDQPSQAISSNVYRGIHGCLELLTDSGQKNWCQNVPSSMSKSSYRRKNHPRSLLLCCYQDMCNHADNPETRVLLNDTNLGDTLNDSDNKIGDVVGSKQDPALYTESEVWFRAATIAVPICGAVILLALIILAIRLLRTESSNTTNQKLGMPPYMLPTENKSNRHHRHHNIIRTPFMDSQHHNPICSSDSEDVQQQSYIPLLIQNEMGILERCDRKNETNAKLNYIQDVESCAHLKMSDCSDHLFYKNTDLHVGRNMILGGGNSFEPHQDACLDKTYNKESIS